MSERIERTTGTAAVPVVVGVADVVQRPGEGTPRHPIALAAEAARLAADDAGAPSLLDHVDSVDVVSIVAWQYADAAGLLAELLGATPRRTHVAPDGGEQPTYLLDEAAARIATGESQVALVAGAEAVRSVELLMKGAVQLDWPAPPADAAPPSPLAHTGEPMRALDLMWPVDVYPLYEQASRRAAGLTQAEATAESARRWAYASEIAAANPSAWLREPRTAAEIATVGDDNRLVAWPYPKLMNAFLSVDQAAAAIVTSTETARRLGVPEDRWVYPRGGALAVEPIDVLERSSLERTDAGAAAIDGGLGLAGLSIADVDLLELYSCFPCVPRMASRHLGLDASHPTTVTGGLTFFGGPGNDYMLHAVAAMVRALRAGRGSTGFLYGQGGFATKHHAMALTRAPGDGGYAVDDRAARQATVDAVPRPAFDLAYEGDGELETFTMPFGRDGGPKRLVLVGRAPDGRRFAGRAEPDDATVAVLTHPDDEPLGRPVRATRKDGATVVELA